MLQLTDGSRELTFSWYIEDVYRPPIPDLDVVKKPSLRNFFSQLKPPGPQGLVFHSVHVIKNYIHVVWSVHMVRALTARAFTVLIFFKS